MDREQYNREARERYAWFKAHNMCPACKRKDERTMNGFVYCEICGEKYRKWNRRKK